MQLADEFMSKTETTLKVIDDGIRPKHNFDDGWRKEADTKIRFVFDTFKPKNFIVIESESLKDRVNEAVEHIHRLLLDSAE